jgi:RND family efflux transporter MFP subunit
MNKWKWASAVIICALFLAMNIMLFDRDETNAVEAPRLKTTMSIQKDFTKKWHVTGMAQSKNNIEIYDVPSRGVIKEISVREGDSVTSGQTLASYENHDLEAELNQLKRNKEAADVKVSHYSSEISDWENELSNVNDEKDESNAKVEIQKQLADAQLQYDLAESDSSVLTDEISDLENKMDELTIKSPVDGVISEINGGNDGQPFIRITGSGNYEIKAKVNASIAGIVKTGDAVRVSSSRSDKTLSGTVQSVIAAEKGESFVLSVFVEDEFTWMEGQKAELILTEMLAHNAVSVPKSSIVRDGEKKYVYTLEKGKLYKVKVDEGLEQDSWIEIQKGFKKGLHVIKNPSKVFVSGEPAIDLSNK